MENLQASHVQKYDSEKKTLEANSLRGSGHAARSFLLGSDRENVDDRRSDSDN